MSRMPEINVGEVAERWSYCLNLHERYAPEWGVWECARELFANAKDASPDGLTLSSPNANTLEIHTPTVPDIAQLFIIGCGSKAPGGESIGQFGEGLKLAALAATRGGGMLTVRLPGQTIGFSLQDHFGQQVLFADVADSEPFDGCLCTLKMEGAGFALNGKIIEGSQSHCLPKDPNADIQIFCKGVWICSLKETGAIYSYNLNDITLNRDRSHADPFSIKYAVGRLLNERMDEALAEKLIQNPTSWEADKCLDAASWQFTDQSKAILAAAMFRLHGEKAVMQTDLENAHSAMELGFAVVGVGDGLGQLLEGRVPTDVAVVGRRHRFTEIQFEPGWMKMLTELKRLSQILGLRSVNVKIFADESGDIVGKAEDETNTVWMNERLWNADNRFERIRTFVHELAHLQSGGHDATTKFEASLDLIGGKLAMLVLDSELGVLRTADLDALAEVK